MLINVGYLISINEEIKKKLYVFKWICIVYAAISVKSNCKDTHLNWVYCYQWSKVSPINNKWKSTREIDYVHSCFYTQNMFLYQGISFTPPW